MKKIILMSALSISLITNGLYAQGAYVSLNTGYGFASSSQSIQNRTSGSNSTTYEHANLSLGKGLNLGGAFGYMFNKNVGAELALSYLIGGTTTVKYNSISSSTSSSNSTNDLSSSILRFNPSMVISSGLDGINPYAKFGVIIGTGSFNVNMNSSNTSSSKTTVTKETTLYNGGLALGITASLGASYKINDKISFFGELALVSMSYAPTKGEITAYTVDGADKLSGLKTSGKMIDFVDTYTHNSSITPSDSEPDQQMKQKFQFGSFGLNIGLKYNL